MVLKKVLSVPWTARRSNQSILKEINLKKFIGRTEAEALILWLPDTANSLEKDCDAWKDRGQEEKGAAEDEMVRQHHQLNGHELKQTPGDSGGQGSLACCSSWRRKESDTT